MLCKSLRFPIASVSLSPSLNVLICRGIWCTTSSILFRIILCIGLPFVEHVFLSFTLSFSLECCSFSSSFPLDFMCSQRGREWTHIKTSSSSSPFSPSSAPSFLLLFCSQHFLGGSPPPASSRIPFLSLLWFKKKRREKKLNKEPKSHIHVPMWKHRWWWWALSLFFKVQKVILFDNIFESPDFQSPSLLFCFAVLGGFSSILNLYFLMGQPLKYYVYFKHSTCRHCKTVENMKYVRTKKNCSKHSISAEFKKKSIWIKSRIFWISTFCHLEKYDDVSNKLHIPRFPVSTFICFITVGFLVFGNLFVLFRSGKFENSCD